MRVLRGLEALGAQSAPADHSDAGSAVCVGMFDGVHLGHLRLLHELLEMASELDATATVVTFENHPGEVLSGDAPPLLVSVPHRLRLLRRAGIERVLLLTFDDKIRNTGPADFARDVLVSGLHTRGLLLGYDSAMGKDRRGTPARFRELGAQLGFEVREAQPFVVDGEPVSSTRIRDAIGRGRLDDAHRLLGRWPSVLGRVVAGDGRGRGLGYPTANVEAQSRVLPPHGVYAAQVIWLGDTWPAIANLGPRPTFDEPGAPPHLEVHVLDFDDDLYGQVLEVCFVGHVRGQRRFDDADALRAQIATDVERARALLDAR